MIWNRFTNSNRKPTARSQRHRGFNFIEVLFAVIILGLGFIMIAGVFPVALQQSNATANETTGALTARDAVRTIQSVAEASGASALFSTATTVTPFSGNLLNAIGNGGIFGTDHRFAWVGFYLRPNTSNGVNGDPYTQVFVIVLQNPNFADPNYPLYNYPPPVPSGATAYTPGTPPTIPAPANPSPILAQLAYSSLNGSSYIMLYDKSIGAGNPVPNATPGAYVLITSDPGNPGNTGVIPNVPPRAANTLTGRFVRLGNLTPQSLLPADVTVPTTPANCYCYALQPGSDLKDLSEETVAASNAGGTPEELPVYIIGGAPDYAGNFTSTNQDIAAMSAFIRVNTSN
jgi:type II secretory pathway pseudopilin PulG